jgi:hypothetical protein
MQKMQKKSLSAFFLYFSCLTDNFWQFGAVSLQKNRKNGRLTRNTSSTSSASCTSCTR